MMNKKIYALSERQIAFRYVPYARLHIWHHQGTTRAPPGHTLSLLRRRRPTAL